jgi:hypothetical protein
MIEDIERIAPRVGRTLASILFIEIEFIPIFVEFRGYIQALRSAGAWRAFDSSLDSILGHVEKIFTS